ncbi:MAG: ABC transporter ATP-binding protein [Bacteroidia bacterium]|jgi:ABC-type multidrug transport system ATPase subunit
MELQLQDVGKRFNRQWLFRNISFHIPSGSACAITGPNGSGKSTLLQIIYQYVVPTAGSVKAKINDLEITPEELVARSAFVSPYLELPEELTLMELLKFHFSMRQGTESDWNAIVSDCGLAGSENKIIRYFSSGMKQRLKLALAFNHAGNLILLDEPCTNLDQQGVNWYLKMIERVRNRQTILVASNQEVEYGFCNQQIQVIA